MTSLGKWFATNAARLIFIAGLVVLIATVVSIRSCGGAQSAKIEAGLAVGQGAAAIASGADAVDTIGNIATAETTIHHTVQRGTDAIQAAPAGNSNAAADRAACELRSYRHSTKCVALLGAAP